VPVAFLIGWTRRERLYNAPRAPSLAGAALVAVSVLMYVAGRLGAELFLTRVSLIGVLAGTIAFVWGREHLRILAFPVAFNEHRRSPFSFPARAPGAIRSRRD